MLTRIDLPVVRESGTGLPVIPGTGLSGTARAYAAMQIDRSRCAGKGGGDGTEHCGRPDCPICIAFGYSRGTAGSRQGLVQISTAHILLAPIATRSGTVWVTSRERLATAGLTGDAPAPADDSHFLPSWVAAPADPANGDFGWLELQRGPRLPSTPRTWTFPSSVKDGAAAAPSGLPAAITGRLSKVAVVPDSIFPTLVNDNLEVRTSVAIDPNTGAAEDKALFTYEAIPRATLFWFDVTVSSPTTMGNVNVDFAALETAVKDGLKLMPFLGVGGMTTRGLGRVEIHE